MPPRISKADTRLISAYIEAANRIERALREVGNNPRRNIFLAKIEPILQQLESLTRDYLQKGLPEHFVQGSREAVEKLRAAKGISTVDEAFTQVHKEALQQLVDSATLNFGNAIGDLRKSGMKSFSKAQKQKVLGEIIASEIEGAANPAARVQEILDDERFVTIQAGNKNFSVEHYASMLTHTILAEAHNTGSMMRYASNGVEFVQIIEREQAPDLMCQWMKGKIVWLGEPRLLNPYHPNCFGSFRPYFGDADDALRSVDDPRIPAEVRKGLLKRG